MASYQVLFSGEVAKDANPDAVRAVLARELGIDEQKAKQMFSGRTVVIQSQLSQDEARTLQAKFAEFGAICRIRDLTPQKANVADFRADKHDKNKTKPEATLRDITAAHLECPRCGHLQLDTSHCARCGVDIGAAIKQKRKEDLIIEKKIRELRNGKPARKEPRVGGGPVSFETADGDEGERKRSWFRKS